jgi:hypothetical protein
MKPAEWTKATRKNGHAIPKLWIRASGTYYAQLAIFDPSKGKNVTQKVCLDTKNLSVAEEKLEKMLGDRAQGELRVRDHGPLFKDYLPRFLEIRKNERNLKTYLNERRRSIRGVHRRQAAGGNQTSGHLRLPDRDSAG